MTVREPLNPARIPGSLRERYLRSGLWDDTSLGTLLIDGLRRRPRQRVGIWSKHTGREETFGSLEATARRVAAGLSKRGLAAGDRVVIWLPNGWEAVAAFVGVAALGAVVVPVASFYGRKELTEIVNATGATVLITCERHGARDYLGEVLDSRTEMPSVDTVVVCAGLGKRAPGSDVVSFDDLLCDPIAAIPSDRSPDDECLLAFTSGTGGTAKGVVHTHRTLGAEVRGHLVAMIPTDATPQIMASPIAHAAGMTLGLLAPIHRGEPIHLVDTFDADFILDTARAEGLAPGGGAAVFLSALIDHPGFTDELAHRMGYVILGGSPVPESLVAKAAQRGITVLRSYGLTEHPTVSASRLGDTPGQLARTDGCLLDGVEVQVRDRCGALLPSGSEGEIFTRGPDRCAGYLQPELNTVFDVQGWLATGDVGVVDADGHLSVTGRAKELIIRNGVKVSPVEVESALMTCAAVAEVAVIGVPDIRTGERAVAVVVARGGREMSLSTLTGHLAAMGLAKPKWPEELRVVDALPRTASGKVRKNEIRKTWLV
ncbi:AMP-binding protein [Mycobacterium sp. AZCC_0083]|uniref:AMP-binding protein n=1 Tax=Mycobacterium sp. AZCC_0083 TaxID=2735882 RepID=UPI001619D631|nr:AMP-binding protein [Mycobacterium sp. AZCC_0083]MBB5162922.1 acyl-CoA synthetase (AMP-forming)/AMP-acid ligase II [Mycobacterium sp. AZCC_0083]